MNTPTPETLARIFNEACERLAAICPTNGPCLYPSEDVTCADCWRRYLLAQAEQERDEG